MSDLRLSSPGSRRRLPASATPDTQNACEARPRKARRARSARGGGWLQAWPKGVSMPIKPMSPRPFLLAGSALWLSVGHGNIALAQTEGAEAPAPLGEIIVTGEKRETSLQRAPIAITALSADALEQGNIQQLNDL